MSAHPTDSDPVMQPSLDGICELVLEAHHMGQLERFYRRLGLTVLSRECDRVWLATGERSRLGIWSPGPKEHADRGGRHVHFALSVTPGTLQQLTGQLRADGVDVKGPVEHEGGDRSTYFFDPEGNRVELWDYFRAGPGEAVGVGALADEHDNP